MMRNWWSRLILRRMTRAARCRPARLAFERLDDRAVPAVIYATGADPGSAPVVTVFNADTNAQLFTINAYDSSFTGGVNVAIGDVNGDGTPDVITGTGSGGAPIVNVFSGVDGTSLNSFNIGDITTRSGVNVGAADFDGDGQADIVVGGLRGGKPLVQILKGTTGTMIREFTPFDGTSAPSVAAGDVNGDGTPDVLVGSGAGGSPRVIVFDGSNGATLFDTFTFETTFTGGITVSAGDLDGDGFADIITAAGNLGGPRVQVFSGKSETVTLNFFAYDNTLRAGVRVSVADSDADGEMDLVTNNGVGQTTSLKAFDGKTGAALAAPTGMAVPVGATADAIAPTVTVTSLAAAVTPTTPIPFTVTFSEPVTGFTTGDVTATNGTVTKLTPSDAKTYSIEVTPNGQGAVSVTVVAGAATDASGNKSTVSTVISRVFDTLAPTVTANALTTNDSTPVLTGTVSDSAATVKVSVANQSLTATVTGTTWTATVTNTIPDGTYTVSVTATDLAGNVGSGSKTNGLIVDIAAPTVTLASSASASTGTNPIPFTVTFSEAINGFAATDLVVTNGSVTGFTATDSKSFVFNVVPTTAGAVTVSVAAGAATDTAGNSSAAASPITRTFTGTPVTAATTSTVTSPSNASKFPITVTFSAAVTGFTSADVGLTNGTVSNFTAVTTSKYTFDVTPSADGSVTVAVPAGIATGPDGGPNSAASTLLIASDRTAPAVQVGAITPDGTNPITFTVTLSDDLTSLPSDKLSATNGTVGTITKVSDRSYTVLVTPTNAAQATVLSVALGTVADQAGNTSALATGTFTPGTDSVGLSNNVPSQNAPGWMTQASGLRIRDLTVGTGAEVVAHQMVTVEYTGWLTNGVEFDSSTDRGTPSTFSLDGVIQGWQEGLLGMKPGGIRDLYVPANLAYGSQNRPGIPPNSDLIFEIKLISST